MKYTDIAGRKYNRLKILSLDRVEKSSRYWVCLCDCGNVKTIREDKIVSAATKSCGCLQKENRIKHGGQPRGTQPHPMYYRWKNMHRRYRDEKQKDFKNYGGRGISVCKEWENFTNFAKWGLENGFSPELQIDRIDNDKGYSPENCRFVTSLVNNNNRRPPATGIKNNIYFEHNRFVVRICIENKNKYFGSFATKEEAIKVRDNQTERIRKCQTK